MTDDAKTVPDSEEKLIDEWMIRDCADYKDEYKECTGFRGRFHQYFIFGEPADCRQWNKDYDNCRKWDKKRDLDAAIAVIESEKQRRDVRLKAHYSREIWEPRQEPPADWAKPLPEWMVKRDENSYLALKSKEMRGEIILEEKKSWCPLM